MEAPKDPLIITDKTQMRKWSRTMRANGKTIGLVPTMGYLHKGHLSLIQHTKNKTNLTVVSIYINPSQFAPSEDLDTYPSDFLGDLEKLKGVDGGVDVVFRPYDLYGYGEGEKHESWVRVENLEKGMCGKSRPVFFRGVATVVAKLFNIVDPDVVVLGKKDYQQWRVLRRMVYDLYEYGEGEQHESWIRVENIEKGMCGKSRPVFFRGVATVMAKLFNIVEPDVVVLGEKDYQHWQVLRLMVRDLDYAIEVIGSEIVREEDGLAMSSRNVHLSPEDRKKALSINQSLSKAKLDAEKGQIYSNDLKNLVIRAVEEAGGKIDYAEIVDQETLEAMEEIKGGVVFCVAAWFGKVRLIDNIEINV